MQKVKPMIPPATISSLQEKQKEAEKKKSEEAKKKG